MLISAIPFSNMLHTCLVAVDWYKLLSCWCTMFEEKFHFILFFKIPLQTILERTQSRIFVHFSCLRCFAHNLPECTGIEIPTKTIAKRTIFIVFIVSFSVLSQQSLRKPQWWQESLPFWRHFSDVNAWKHFNASFNEFFVKQDALNVLLLKAQ